MGCASVPPSASRPSIRRRTSGGRAGDRPAGRHRRAPRRGRRGRAAVAHLECKARAVQISSEGGAELSAPQPVHRQPTGGERLRQAHTAWYRRSTTRDADATLPRGTPSLEVLRVARGVAQHRCNTQQGQPQRGQSSGPRLQRRSRRQSVVRAIPSARAASLRFPCAAARAAAASATSCRRPCAGRDGGARATGFSAARTSASVKVGPDA